LFPLHASRCKLWMGDACCKVAPSGELQWLSAGSARGDGDAACPSSVPAPCCMPVSGARVCAAARWQYGIRAAATCKPRLTLLQGAVGHSARLQGERESPTTVLRGRR
jgi:hypothetical protein